MLWKGLNTIKKQLKLKLTLAILCVLKLQLGIFLHGYLRCVYKFVKRFDNLETFNEQICL